MRLRALGQADLVSNLMNSIGSEVIIRSQFTPEIRINLANLMAGKKKEDTFKSDGGNVFMTLLRPEIVVRSAGLEYPVAPYGRPTQDFRAILVAGAVGMAALGGSLAYWFCKRAR